MAQTWRYTVSDILQTLKKENASSDLNFSQVLFWASSIANKLRYQHLVKSPTGRYLNIFTGITVQASTTSSNPNTIAGRKYVDLPEAVYDILYEKGIKYICHDQDVNCPPEFMNLYFQPISAGATAQRLMYSPYEEPSPKNPYFYRVENRIFFLGIEQVNVKSLEMGLYTSLNMRTNLVDPDSECDLTEQHLDILRRQLLDLGAFSSSVPSDRAEDANDSATLKARPVQQPQNATE